MPKHETIAVLIWRQKHGDYYVAARDGGEELRAYLHIFKMMDEQGYYSYDDALGADEKVGYEAARGGNAKAAKWLLDCRSGYEYEEVVREVVMFP